MAANGSVEPIEYDGEDLAMEGQQQTQMHQRPDQNAELPTGSFSEIINAAAQAATMSVLAALTSGALTLPYSVPGPPQPAGTNENGSPDPDENQPVNQPFQRMCRCVTSV